MIFFLFCSSFDYILIYLSSFALQEKELDNPLPWLVLFDHTHQKDKGKGAYADKKSEVVAVSFHILFYFSLLCYF